VEALVNTHETNCSSILLNYLSDSKIACRSTIPAYVDGLSSNLCKFESKSVVFTFIKTAKPSGIDFSEVHYVEHSSFADKYTNDKKLSLLNELSG
jgi:hypothetical protein